MQTLWKSVKVEGERARIALKVLETLTYSCDSPQDLYQLTSQVEELVTEFRGKLPQSEGSASCSHFRKSDLTVQLALSPQLSMFRRCAETRCQSLFM